MKRTLAAVISGLALCGAVLPAQATPTRYNLTDVKFTDGTAATGFFTIDWAAKTWSDFDVATADGRLPAFDYKPTNSGIYFNGFGPNSFSIDRQDGRRYFTFSFDQPLTASGTFLINTTFSWDCDNCGNYRNVASGSVTTEAPAAVPEPASIALMIPALAMVGAMSRRRKDRAAK